MVKRAIVATIDFCTSYAWATIAIGVIIASIAGYYTEEHFAINTDVNTLISEKLPWRQRELSFDKSFPDSDSKILAVVDAPTPELASLARSALAENLSEETGLFPSVTELGGTPFFAQNGLLFLPKEQVGGIMHELSEAAPLVRVPVADPSLRGLAQMVAFGLAGVREKQLTLEDTARPFNAAFATYFVRRVPRVMVSAHRCGPCSARTRRRPDSSHRPCLSA